MGTFVCCGTCAYCDDPDSDKCCVCDPTYSNWEYKD